MSSSSSKSKKGRPPKNVEQVEDVGEYVVEAIRDERIGETGEKEYRVKWEGYEEKDNTWEPVSNMTQCTDALARWEAAKSKNGASGSRSVSKSKTHSEQSGSGVGKTGKQKGAKRSRSSTSDSAEPEEERRGRALAKSARKEGNLKSENVSIVREPVSGGSSTSGKLFGRNADNSEEPGNGDVAGSSDQKEKIRKTKESGNEDEAVDDAFDDDGSIPASALGTPRKNARLDADSDASFDSLGVRTSVQEDALMERGSGGEAVISHQGSFIDGRNGVGSLSKFVPGKKKELPRADSRSSTVSVEDLARNFSSAPNSAATSSSMVKNRVKDKIRPPKPAPLQGSPELPVTFSTGNGVFASTGGPSHESSVSQQSSRSASQKIHNGPHQVNGTGSQAISSTNRYTANGQTRIDSAAQTTETVIDDPLTRPIPPSLQPFKGEIDRLRWMAPFATAIKGIIPVKNESPENCLCLIAFNENGVEKSAIFMKRITKFVMPLLLIRFYEQYLELPSSGNVPRPGFQ